MPSTPPALLILGPVIGAIIALAGTVITNFFAERRHARESIERQRDKAETKRTEQERVDIDRQLTALDYVEHLESYALQCANVVTFNAGFDHDHQEMKSLKALPAWPGSADRALCDHARKGHRPGPGDRQAHLRGPRRRAEAGRRRDAARRTRVPDLPPETPRSIRVAITRIEPTA